MDKVNNNDYDYTIVLDGSYISEAVSKEVPRQSAAEAGGAGDDKKTIDRMYQEYEAMCLKEPTILDTDDAYPRSYYWRAGDRYDEEKVKVLEEALRLGVRISDTEAYQLYTEKLKNSRFTPDSWD